MASRLTTNVETGLEVEVSASASEGPHWPLKRSIDMMSDVIERPTRDEVPQLGACSVHPCVLTALACSDMQIQGDAVALFTSPGEDLGLAQWQELDNVIYDELLEFFGQGLRPKPADLDRLVADFKAGRFRYGQHDAANDEDENKDDGSLPGWG